MGGRAFPLVSRCHSSVVKEKREGLMEGSERSPWSHPVHHRFAFLWYEIHFRPLVGRTRGCRPIITEQKNICAVPSTCHLMKKKKLAQLNKCFQWNRRGDLIIPSMPTNRADGQRGNEGLAGWLAGWVLLSARHGRKGTLSPDTNQPPVAFAFQLEIIEMKSPTERPAGSFVSFFIPRPKMACRYKYAGQRVVKCHNLFVIRAVSFNLFIQVRTAIVEL